MANDSTGALRDAIISFYRSELENRYKIGNVRRFEEFAAISDERVDMLREYFLERIYPPVAQRAELDQAVDHLGGVLRSPVRMRPLLGTAIAGIWKLGSRLPAAVSAGLATVDAYRESRKLEQILLDYALKTKVAPRDTVRRATMVGLIVGIPEKDVKRLIYDILKLFHALSNTEMLEAAVEMMNLFIKTMKGNPKYFDQSDMDGVTLGRDMVQGGLDLFLQMERKEFDHIIEGIERIELDWFDRICAEAAGAAA